MNKSINNPINSTHNKFIASRLLLFANRSELHESVCDFLESIGHEVITYTSAENAIKALSNEKFDLVISDLCVGELNGISLLSSIQKLEFPPPVIIITEHGCVPTAVEAMRRGAFHYLNKPCTNEELQDLINEALAHCVAIREAESLRNAAKKSSHQGFIYKSPETTRLLNKIQRFARSDSSVFLIGESGTGKEVAANYLHKLSNRSDKPFLAINCGAIPENLLESELFGYVKGAFTGADKHHEGLLSRANGGTILLDEIGDLPLSLQVKLLRVLQERSIRPVGSSKEIPIDVRIISATHQDIQEMVKNNTFREDLYYRLHVIPIQIPPLRKRREDIPLLAQSFLDKAAGRMRNNIKGFTQAAMEQLITRAWPGNIRELMNAVEYAVALVEEGWIDADAIPESLQTTDPEGHLLPLMEARAHFENDYLEHLMRLTAGNVAQSARIAGRYRPDMYKLLRKHNITPADFKHFKVLKK
ncbi:MAG TPA: sigma-54-dependent Fis family transcriptional regulator [Gammaproteobacteria bacterium]|nr:sigma-54-dependent Fis family transcriptional regulator [Gammaproteobacteria bacterium]